MKSLQCLCKNAFIQCLKLQGNSSRQSSNMSNKTTKEIFPSICSIVSPTSSGISYIPEPHAWTIDNYAEYHQLIVPPPHYLYSLSLHYHHKDMMWE